jgi:hypothetical protein
MRAFWCDSPDTIHAVDGPDAKVEGVGALFRWWLAPVVAVVVVVVGWDCGTDETRKEIEGMPVVGGLSGETSLVEPKTPHPTNASRTLPLSTPPPSPFCSRLT